MPVFDRNCESSRRKFGSPQALLPTDSAHARAPIAAAATGAQAGRPYGSGQDLTSL
jgi:hypothetical protein